MRGAFILAVLAIVEPALAQTSSGLRDVFLPQVTQEAVAAGLPPEIADAVAIVESGYHPEAIGTSGEIGIMQILPGTAAQLGFNGTPTELREPSINIHLAVQYLSRAWAQSGGDICRALTKYRAGLGETVTTPLSAQYCARAMGWLMGGRSHAEVPAIAPEVAAADPHVVTIVPAMARAVQVLGPTKQAPELYYGALAAPAADTLVQQAMPPMRPVHPAAGAGGGHRLTARLTALQANFDSHVKMVGNQTATSFDPAD